MKDLTYFDLYTIEDVIKSVCGVDFLKDQSRRRHVVDARIIFSSLARSLTQQSLACIGKYMNKNHATVLHHARQADSLRFSDKSFAEKYDECIKELDTLSEEKIMEWTKMQYHLKRAEHYKVRLETA